MAWCSRMKGPLRRRSKRSRLRRRQRLRDSGPNRKSKRRSRGSNSRKLRQKLLLLPKKPLLRSQRRRLKLIVYRKRQMRQKL